MHELWNNSISGWIFSRGVRKDGDLLKPLQMAISTLSEDVYKISIRSFRNPF